MFRVLKPILTASIALAVSASTALAASAILAPTNTIYGGQSDGTDFTIGAPGFTQGSNNWPGNENPEKAIDGKGQKYLNFGKENTGLVVVPGAASVITSLQIWTANDVVERDPASYALYGTNSALAGGNPGDTFSLSLFSLISSGDLALPDERNFGGDSPLGSNFQIVDFANTQSYTAYMLIFPTLKPNDQGVAPTVANSMQISEVQFYGTFGDGIAPVPLPAGGLLLLSGLALMGARRSRR